MGFKQAMIPLAFLVISIIGIATTALTVKTYLDENKEKDATFNFSAFILAVSVLGVIVSGFFAYKGFKSGGSTSSGYVNTGAVSSAAVNNESALEKYLEEFLNTNLKFDSDKMTEFINTNASKEAVGKKLADYYADNCSSIKFVNSIN